MGRACLAFSIGTTHIIAWPSFGSIESSNSISRLLRCVPQL